MADAILKTCRKCGLDKPLSMFKANERYHGGRIHHCKDCIRESDRIRYATNPDRARQKSKAWADANRDTARLMNKAHYDANADRMRQRTRARRHADPAQSRERERAYYEANSDKIRERRKRYSEDERAYKQAWRKRNKGLVNASTAQRFAAKMRATPAWANLSAIRAMYEQAAALGLHVDHIVPLRSPAVCGLHCEANLQLLPPTENIRKGNRQWPDMWEPA